MFNFIMSISLLLLSIFQGLRMFLDGIYNMVTGNYISNNDYWWYIVKALDMNPEKWGIVFLIFGILWLGASILYLYFKVAGRIVIGILCLFSFWNIVWGTVIAALIFIINIFVGNKPILNAFSKKYQ